MLKLINDKVIQCSDAPDALKSAALSEYYETSDITLTFAPSITLDCLGIGYTDGVNFTLTITAGLATYTETLVFDGSGLYQLSKEYASVSAIRIVHDGTLIGRIGAGKCRNFTLARSREPGFYSTEVPRVTASGQVIPGAGGMSGRQISVDIRSHIDSDMYQDFVDAFPAQISKGYPFFIYFNKETYRMPYKRLYASCDNAEMIFQSSLNLFKYSRGFEYIERF